MLQLSAVCAVVLIAYESGEICELLDCSFDWIITGVRLTSKTTVNYQIVAPRYSVFDDQYFYGNYSYGSYSNRR